jgi:phosphoribosylaminoimidazole-succinocarboxamide synthase
VLDHHSTAQDALHDELISAEEVVSSGRMTQAEWDECSKIAHALFAYGQRIAAERGLILVDTKYELGRDAQGNIIVVDEIHTPDSSR